MSVPDVTHANAAHVDSDWKEAISRVLLCQRLLYNITLVQWKQQRADYLWCTLHLFMRSFQVPSFSQQPCWAWPKVQLPNSGASLWGTSVGSVHPQHLWMLQQLHVATNCKYRCITSCDGSAREHWRLTLAITHGSTYLNTAEEFTIIP